MVKNPPAMQMTKEMWVQSLDGEDPLEKGMAIHSSTLAWRNPWSEVPGGTQIYIRITDHAGLPECI